MLHITGQFSSTIHSNLFTDPSNFTKRDQSNTAAIIGIGISTAILLILSSALIITAVVLIRNYRRRSAKQELNNDALYSRLNRGSKAQVQPQSTQQNSNRLYDQIHLSPSTGQTEFIPKPQSKNINNPFYNYHSTNPDTENAVTSASAESQANSPQATNAAVDNSKRKKVKKDDTKHTAAAEKYTQKVLPSKWAHNMEGEGQFKHRSWITWCSSTVRLLSTQT